jgi:CheY-like chemotaxis protein
MYKLLILDDEPSIINAMVRLIARIPHEQLNGRAAVRTFTDPALALECISEEAFDLIITDFRMPSMDGLTFLQQAIEHQPDVARIIISGHADLPVVLSAVNAARIFRFVSKPWARCNRKTSDSPIWCASSAASCPIRNRYCASWKASRRASPALSAMRMAQSSSIWNELRGCQSPSFPALAGCSAKATPAFRFFPRRLEAPHALRPTTRQ